MCDCTLVSPCEVKIKTVKFENKQDLKQDSCEQRGHCVCSQNL